MPSLTPLLGGLRTTPSDEYGFWTVSPTGHPSAIPPFTLSFSTTALDGHALLTADEEGVLTVLDTRRSLQAQMHVQTPEHAPPARFRGHDNAIFDAIWLPSDKNVATASGDASARVFDVQSSLRVALLRGHSGSVKAIRAHPASPSVLLTAARDGNVRAFDLRVPNCYEPTVCREVFHKPVFELLQPHARPVPAADTGTRKRRRIRAEAPPASVTSLAFMPGREHLLFTGGAGDGTVKLWDVRGAERQNGKRLSAMCVASATPGLEGRAGGVGAAVGRRRHGIASIDVDAAGRYVAVSATDSTIYLYDAADITLGVTKRLVGHTQTSFYIRSKFSSCGKYLMSGSADSCAYIWDVGSYGMDGRVGPALRLEGHRGGEAAGVAWCAADGFKVATCGDDATARVWRVKRGERALDPVEKRDEPVNAACQPVALEETCGRGRKRGEGRIEGRAVKASVQRRRLVDADIRSFFGKNEAGRENGCKVNAAL